MGKRIFNTLLFTVGEQLWDRLSPRLRLKAGGLLLAQAMGSFLEVLSIAAIVPVIITLARPGMTGSSAVINRIYRFFGSPVVEDFMLYLLIALVGFFVLKTLFLVYVSYLEARFAFWMSLEIARNQSSNYLNAEYSTIKKKNSYVLLNNSMQVPTQTAYGLVLPMLALLSEGLVTLLILAAITVYKPALLLALVLTIGPVLLIVFLSIKQKVAKIGVKANRLNPMASEGIHNAYKGFVDLRLHQKESYFGKKFTNNLYRIYRLLTLRHTYNVIPQKVTEFAAILAILIIFIFTRATGGSSEELVVFLSLFAAAAYRLLPSFGRIFSSVMNIKNHQYIINILEPNYKAKPATNKEVAFEKSLQLQNLTYTFSDDNKQVLKGVDATINKGDIIGIFGPSGSGKSTLMYMILGFLYPTSGKILIDGVPLQKEDIRAWQKKLALVKQEIFLLDVDIKSNIAFGETDQDLPRIKEALKLAGLENFIAELPAGIDTRIGEEGVRLSSGQQQRLGIARALYKNAELMVFDEATNAIDIKTEQEIIAELDKLRNMGKTIILIAHRHTTLKKCNRIFTMQKGRITSQTTYAELTTELRAKKMI